MSKIKVFKQLAAAFAAVIGIVLPSLADRTISENYTLESNEDWTGDGVITLSGNPTIDLAGYTLKVASITGAGAVISSMTDLTSPSGTVTSEGGFSLKETAYYPASHLFDNDTSTLAVRTDTSGNPLIVVYDFGDGSATAINCYRLYAAKPSSVPSPGFPVEWTFEGSNDNSDWTELDARSGQTLADQTWFTFDFSNTTAYRYYRMKVTKGSRYNTSTSKDPRIDFGGEMELGFATRGKLSVDLSGVAASDLSGIAIGDRVDVETFGDSLVLDTDVNMSGFPVSATIDLKGHTLTVSSLAGGGTITDTSAPAYTNTPASVTASRALSSGYPASNLFDGNTSTLTIAGNTTTEPLILTFGFNEATLINYYSIYADSTTDSHGLPKEWTFEGSNDNSSWTVLDSHSDVTMSRKNWYEYDFANTTAYTYYRLNITKGNRWASGSNPRIDVGGEMKLCRRVPGKVVLNVPAGKTVENTDVTLSGSLQLVKDGEGTLVVSKSGQSYTGGTEVADGTLKCGAAVAGLFGAEGMEISIVTNGTFDIAGIRASGVNALGKYAFTLNGGTLANSVQITGSANYQSPMRLALAADSSFDISDHGFLGTETTGVVGEFDLGGHTLSGAIANGKYFRINNMVLENGRFKVEDSTSGMLFIGYGEGVVATNVDFMLNCPVVVRDNCAFKVRDYEALGGTRSANTQSGPMEVYGTFTPTSDSFYGCTLMYGSTLDLSTRSTTLNPYSNFTAGATTLKFEENATVNVTVGDRKVSSLTPIMSWTEETKPANIDTVTFVRADADRKYSIVRKSDGLYLETGFIIIFR